VFFDGEEAVARWSPVDGLDGSRHFAKRVAENGSQDQIKAVIVVDMIGDARLDIQRDSYSTPWLTDLVFTQAKRLGYGRYFLKLGRRIEDDHLAFLRLGIPAMDVIDLNYGPFNLYWHRRSDTRDKCNSASLAIVWGATLNTLAALESRLDPGLSQLLHDARRSCTAISDPRLGRQVQWRCGGDAGISRQ
jgi:glutaminyl-peptide cyclotransferase